MGGKPLGGVGAGESANDNAISLWRHGLAAAARRSALARCRAGSATDADRALLAAPSADGRTMLGPAECQRCAQHPRRRLTYRWEWPAGSGPDAGDAVELRGCEECADET